MTAFAELGEKLKQFYGRASQYLDPAARFAVALIVFFWIRSNTGWNAAVSNPLVLLAAAAVCALIGSGSIPVVGALIVTANAFSIGIDAGIVTLVVFLILLLLLYRFSEGCGMETALLPVLMFFGLTILIPLLCGLRKRISSVFAVISATVSYYLIAALSRLEAELSAMESTEYIERLRVIVTGIFTNEMILMVLALTAVVLIVYSVRQMTIDYAFYAAAVFGSILYLIFVILGNSVLDTDISLLLAFVGTLASCAIACIILLVFLPLDFRKSERLRFEDDDYYYYVKAVPKVKIGDDFDDDEDDDDEYDDGRHDDGGYDSGRYDDDRYDDSRYEGDRYRDAGRYRDDEASFHHGSDRHDTDEE